MAVAVGRLMPRVAFDEGLDRTRKQVVIRIKEDGEKPARRLDSGVACNCWPALALNLRRVDHAHPCIALTTQWLARVVDQDQLPVDNSLPACRGHSRGDQSGVMRRY